MTALDALRLKGRFRWWAPLRAGRFPSFYDSHSQFGEDMVVRALLGDRTHGTFVDVGAHHPVYYSNTYYFYRRGWRGLNIDALPNSMDAFRVLRPEDQNVEACVAPTSGETVTLYRFEDTALTTIDPAAARSHEASGKRLLDARAMTCVTLGECLDRYLPGRPIDFLSIDVEGLDEAILRSLDWSRVRPHVVVFERHHLSIDDAARDGLITYLAGQGYVVEGKCGPSFVLRNVDAPAAC
jgi:FkbM family methyltransferase